jgi:hypothetical protein
MRTYLQSLSISLRGIAGTALLLLSVASTQGQIINIENRRMHTDSVRWAGSFQMSLLLNSTNGKNIFTVRGNTAAQLKSKNYRHLWLGVANYDFAKADEENFVNNFFVHFRYNYKWTNWLRWELFLQTQANEPLGFAYRNIAGTGPRFKIRLDQNNDIYLGTAVMYEREKTIPPESTIREHFRSSSYLSFDFRIPRVNGFVTSTTYYQPLFEDLSDHRIMTETRLRFMITDRWNVYTTFSYYYDSRPPANIRKSALNLEQGFGFTF